MSSIWDDVRVDAVATDVLIGELLATARAVGEAVGILEGDGPLVADDWGGPHRDAFDGDRAQIARRARVLVEELELAARQVAVNLASAEGEQRLRVRLRDRVRAAAECDGPC